MRKGGEISIKGNILGKKILVTLAVLVVLFLGIFLFFRFQYRMDDDPDDTVSKYLVCKKSNADGHVLFSDEGGKNVNYESRIIFLNDNIYRVNFVVSKYFSNEKSTAAFTDKMHAAYNVYAGKNNVSKNGIITTFTNVDNIGKMVISMDGDVFDKNSAPLVMLGGLDAGVNFKIVEEEYIKNGFSCSVEEQDMVLSD